MIFAESDLVLAILIAVGFWLQISLGTVSILLIHEVTGGRWGNFAHPVLRSCLPTFWVTAIAFVPVVWLSQSIYGSSLPHSLMNPLFFGVRSFLYFASWIAIAQGYLKRKTRNLQAKAWAGGSLIVLLFTVTLAAMDWFMNLDPEFASTGFGVVFISGALLAGFAFQALMTLERDKLFTSQISKSPIMIDFGNLVLMASLFWAYVAFMQYLIVWSGQIPKEIAWYDRRTEAGWSPVFIAMIALEFVLPFTALLFRSLKQRPQVMKSLMVGILFGRFLDNAILVGPIQSTSVVSTLFAAAIAALVIGIPWALLFRHALKNNEVPKHQLSELEVAT